MQITTNKITTTTYEIIAKRMDFFTTNSKGDLVNNLDEQIITYLVTDENKRPVTFIENDTYDEAIDEIERLSYDIESETN